MKHNSANRDRAYTLPQANQPQHPNFANTIFMTNKRKSSGDELTSKNKFNDDDSEDDMRGNDIDLRDDKKMSKRKTITLFDRTELDRSLWSVEPEQFPELSFPVIKIHHILSYKQQKRILKLTRYFFVYQLEVD